MSDDHKTTVALVEHQPTEIMHPMVRMAMEAQQNLDTKTMAELMDLQERYQKEQAKRAFDVAMVRLKEDLPKVIGHDKDVAYKNTRYSHTSLAAAMEAVTGPLSANGFALTWRTSNQGNQVSVTAVLTHSQGHFIDDATLTAPVDTSGSKNGVQAIASTVTYLKRYTALSLLGIATQDMREPRSAPDDDSVDEARNMKALGKLKQFGKTKDEAEEFIGKPFNEWTFGDLLKLREWLRPAGRDYSEIDVPDFDQAGG